MEKVEVVRTREDVERLLVVALKHEWAVSFEYVIHAYSMPKGKSFYADPVMEQRMDIRAQTIQIGIDEMYHALQLGVILAQMGVEPTFETDEIVRHPLILDNLKRDKKTEDVVTALYQSPEIEPGAHAEIENMIWNVSYDEVRHAAQFQAMIDTMEAAGASEAPCLRPHPDRESRADLAALHEICRLENALAHHDLKGVMLFSGHQDLTQRLFKNAIDHMRHWDKTAGLLVKLGDVIAIENAEKDAEGVERSARPMPGEYAGRDRLSILEALLPAEQHLAARYEEAADVVPAGDVLDQVRFQLGLTREHIFTQEKLLANARRIKGLA